MNIPLLDNLTYEIYKYLRTKELKCYTNYSYPGKTNMEKNVTCYEPSIIGF